MAERGFEKLRACALVRGSFTVVGELALAEI
jgi:hypothetical protein